MRRAHAYAAAAVLAAAGLAAWWLVERPAVVRVATPVRGPAVEAIYATGTVEPVRWVKAGPTVAGRIVEFDCEEGAHVRQGQVLLRLDDESVKARIAELEAMVRFREQEVARYQALLKSEAVSRQNYERVRSDVDQGRAALAAARQALADTTVTAPLDGVVLREDGEVGQVVQPGEPLCWIGQEKPLRITAEIDEEDIPRLSPGQRALIKADAFPDRVLEGRVAEITPQGDPIAKSYRARIALPADSPLLVGMTTEINVVVREETAALLVPVGAYDAGGVWVVEGGRARRRAVTAGVFGDELVEIRDGLAPDAAVVVEHRGGLEDGDAVRVAGE